MKYNNLYPINKSSITPKIYPEPKNIGDSGYSFESLDGEIRIVFFTKQELVSLKKEINKVLKEYETI